MSTGYPLPWPEAGRFGWFPDSPRRRDGRRAGPRRADTDGGRSGRHPADGGRLAASDPTAEQSAGSDRGGRPHRHRHGPRGRGFGAGGFGPGGRGRRARRGDVRLAILALLAEGPRHGYQVIQDIAERTDGAWRPSAGAVYPALAQLEDAGLVRATEDDERKVFHLTDTGAALVTERSAEIDALWAAGSVPQATADLLDLGRQLATAVQEVLRSGTPEQMARARDVLAAARRSMYLILADTDPGDPGDPARPR